MNTLVSTGKKKNRNFFIVKLFLVHEDTIVCQGNKQRGIKFWVTMKFLASAETRETQSQTILILTTDF